MNNAKFKLSATDIPYLVSKIHPEQIQKVSGELFKFLAEGIEATSSDYNIYDFGWTDNHAELKTLFSMLTRHKILSPTGFCIDYTNEKENGILIEEYPVSYSIYKLPVYEDCFIVNSVNYPSANNWSTSQARFILIPKKYEGDILVEILTYIFKLVADSVHKVSLQRQDDALMGRLFLPKSIKNGIINYIQTFLDNREFYAENNLPWKTGILLYGPPGNGKTLFIKAISAHFGISITSIKQYINDRGELELPNTRCSTNRGKEWISPSDVYPLFYPKDKIKPNIIYIEDLEKIMPSKGTEVSDRAIMTLTTLLQALDGVEELHNTIIIATTNHLHQNYESLVARPGRFDFVVEIALPKEEQMLEMFDYYHLDVDGKNKEVAKKLKDNRASMAFVESFVKSCILKFKKLDLNMDEADLVLDGIFAHNKLIKYLSSSDNTIGFGGETKIEKEDHNIWEDGPCMPDEEEVSSDKPKDDSPFKRIHIPDPFLEEASKRLGRSKEDIRKEVIRNINMVKRILKKDKMKI